MIVSLDKAVYPAKEEDMMVTVCATLVSGQVNTETNFEIAAGNNPQDTAEAGKCKDDCVTSSSYCTGYTKINMYILCLWYIHVHVYTLF